MQKLVGTLGSYDEATRSVHVLASTPKPVDGEALVSWDLERFKKNPVILWAHDNTQLPLGLAHDIVETPEGLKMRVRFSSAEMNPMAEQVRRGVAEGVIRGLSVGFDPGPGKEEKGPDGKIVKRSANVLAEVSFVPVPKDENALVLENEEDRKQRISNAASELAKSRQTRTDAVQRFDRSTLGKFQRTSVGGARVPARLSRTGILIYRNPDGSQRRELRLPDEVFKADSLKTLEDVPVVDITHHTAMVTPDTWKGAALGHVKTWRQDGKFIEAELVIQDGPTLDDIESGSRTEISCGYECKLDWTPGVWNGEPYDCIQRDIKYNHVALCPPNRGRAGPEVGLRLDANGEGAESLLETEENTMTIKVRLDGREYEEGSRAHLDALDASYKQALAAEQTKTAETKKQLDEAQGRLDAATAAAKKREEDEKLEEEKRKRSESERAASFRTRLKERFKRFSKILRAFGEDEDEDEEDEEKMGKKYDALIDACLDDAAGKELMIATIKKSAPQFNADGKSDAYIEARFDQLLEQVPAKNTPDDVVRAAVIHTRTDAKDGRGKNFKVMEGVLRKRAAERNGETTPANGGAK